MRNVLLFGLALVLLAGCNKLRGSRTTTAAAPPDVGTVVAPGGSGDPGVHAPTGVVIQPLRGGGSGGAVQAVRGAVNRSVNEVELTEIRKLIELASESGNAQMPTAEEIKREVQKDNPKLYKLLEDGTIQLTGTKNRDNIWACTMFPQGSGLHSILTAKGIERVDPDTLKRRLKEQEGK